MGAGAVAAREDGSQARVDLPWVAPPSCAVDTARARDWVLVARVRRRRMRHRRQRAQGTRRGTPSGRLDGGGGALRAPRATFDLHEVQSGPGTGLSGEKGLVPRARISGVLLSDLPSGAWGSPEGPIGKQGRRKEDPALRTRSREGQGLHRARPEAVGGTSLCPRPGSLSPTPTAARG